MMIGAWKRKRGVEDVGSRKEGSNLLTVILLISTLFGDFLGMLHGGGRFEDR